MCNLLRYVSNREKEGLLLSFYTSLNLSNIFININFTFNLEEKDAKYKVNINVISLNILYDHFLTVYTMRDEILSNPVT